MLVVFFGMMLRHFCIQRGHLKVYDLVR